MLRSSIDRKQNYIFDQEPTMLDVHPVFTSTENLVEKNRKSYCFTKEVGFGHYSVDRKE